MQGNPQRSWKAVQRTRTEVTALFPAEHHKNPRFARGSTVVEEGEESTGLTKTEMKLGHESTEVLKTNKLVFWLRGTHE